MNKRKSERTRLVAALRDVPLFEECTDAQLLRINSLLTEVRVGPGTVLSAGGANALQFMIVRDGVGRVSSRGRDIGTVGQDACFGAAVPSAGGFSDATIRAESPMRVFVLNLGEFQAMLSEAPSVGRRLALAGTQGDVTRPTRVRVPFVQRQRGDRRTALGAIQARYPGSSGPHSSTDRAAVS